MLKPLLYKSYLQTIINSVGSTQYRNFYVYDTEKYQYGDANGIKDVLENGNLSCAIFVSNILHMFSGFSKLIDIPHSPITTTIKDMERNGWYEIDDLKVGAILKWQAIDYGVTGWHYHIGFYIGNDEAVSNDYKQSKISKHSHNYNGTRKIEKIYWHDSLDYTVL